MRCCTAPLLHARSPSASAPYQHTSASACAPYQRLLRRYLHFCTSKPSKPSTCRDTLSRDGCAFIPATSIRQHTSAYVSIRQHTSAHEYLLRHIEPRRVRLHTRDNRFYASLSRDFVLMFRIPPRQLAKRLRRGAPRQYLCLCTSKASKLST